ncbi:MAG: 5'-nucleotidase C-terminal domain-containing protein, partial [Bacteroidota bacterium]
MKSNLPNSLRDRLYYYPTSTFFLSTKPSFYVFSVLVITLFFLSGSNGLSSHKKKLEPKASVSTELNSLLFDDGNILGQTSVYLEGRRDSVRFQETNLGNLIADSYLSYAKAFDPTVEMALVLSGSIRREIGETIDNMDGTFTLNVPAANPGEGKQAGDISQLDVENALPFNYKLFLLTTTSVQLIEALENAVSRIEGNSGGTGRFLQVSGLRFKIDPTATIGSRVEEIAIVLPNGALEPIMVNKINVAPSRTIRFVTVSIVAEGMDGYRFDEFPNTNPVDLTTVLSDPGNSTFASLGVEQDALAEYLFANFKSPDNSPYNIADTPIEGDLRIMQDSRAIFCPTTSNSVLFVDKSKTVSGDGSSWNNAIVNLQDALSVACNCPGVTEIWVAKGTYYPDEGFNQINNDRNSTFQLCNNVAIYGGFSGDGSEDELSDRDVETNVTILSGDIDQDDASFAPDTDSDSNSSTPTQTDHLNGSNAYTVVTGSGTNNTAIIDGFTLTAGKSDGSSTPASVGGGIFNDGGTPIINQLIISGNSTGSGPGGGMYNQNASPTITNSTISANSTVSGVGGGIYNTTSSPTITNVTISGNSALNGPGGGIYNISSSNPIITNSVISKNIAGNSGGGIFNNGSSPSILDIVISENSAGNGPGGGIYNFSNSNPVITNGVISGNTTNNAGGGIYNSGSSLSLINVVISGNSAVNGPGGGIYNISSSNPIITNSVISGNTTGNTGGGMFNQSSTPTLTNTIIWNNRDVSGITGATASIGNSSSTPVITYSIIANSGFTGTSPDFNKDEDPQFVMGIDLSNLPSTAGNFSLQPGSPALNMGNNNADIDGANGNQTIQNIQTDLEGGPRILQDIVDIGAFEVFACPATPPTVSDQSACDADDETNNDAHTFTVTPTGGNIDLEDEDTYVFYDIDPTQEVEFEALAIGPSYMAEVDEGEFLNLWVTARDISADCESEPTMITLTVNSTPEFDVQNLSFCETASSFVLKLQSVNNVVVGATYELDYGSSGLPNSTGTIAAEDLVNGDIFISITVPDGLTPAEYASTLTITNPTTACGNTDTFDLTVQAAPTTDAGENQTVCAGANVALNAANDLSGTWTGGEGEFDDASKPNAIYTPNESEIGGAPFFLTWTTISEGVCPAASDNVEITILAPLSVEASLDQEEICFPESEVFLTFTGNGGTAPYTISYQIGDGEEQTISTDLNSVANDGDAIEVLPIILSEDTEIKILKIVDSSEPQCEQDLDQSVAVDLIIEEFTAIDGAVCLGDEIDLTNLVTIQAEGAEVELTFNISDVIIPALFTPTEATDQLMIEVVAIFTGPNGLECMEITTFNLQVEDTRVELGDGYTDCGLFEDIELDAMTFSEGTWTTNGDGTFEDNRDPIAVYFPAGTDLDKTITFTYTTDAGIVCPSRSDDLEVFLQGATVSVQDGAVCLGDEIDLTSLITIDGDASDFEITFEDDFGEPIPALFTPEEADEELLLFVFIEGLDEEACPDELEFTLLVEEPQTLELDENYTICSTDEEFIDLFAEVNAEGTWTTDGSGEIDDDREPETFYTIAEEDIGKTITFTFTTDEGETCPSISDDLEVFIQGGTVTVEDGAVCLGDEIDLTGLVTIDGDPADFEITFTDDFGEPIPALFTPEEADEELLLFVFIESLDGEACPDELELTLLVEEPQTLELDENYTICSADEEFIDLFAEVNAEGTWTTNGSGEIDDNRNSETFYTIEEEDLGKAITFTFTTNAPQACPGDPLSESFMVFIEIPAIADAGPDQTGVNGTCSTSTTLQANTPTAGPVEWTITGVADGQGMLSDPNDPLATFSGTLGQTYTLTWTISNDVCTDSRSTVDIEFFDIPDPTATNRTICSSDVMLDGNNPAPGTGEWSIVSGDGNAYFGGVPGILTTLNPTDFFSGTRGQAYVLQYKISANGCEKTTQVTIILQDDPTPANAGPDQTGSNGVCGPSTTLQANTPTVGTGMWTITGLADGQGMLSDPTDPQASFSGTLGQTYTLTWTISNGVCDNSSDPVSIEFFDIPDPTATNRTICS